MMIDSVGKDEACCLGMCGREIEGVGSWRATYLVNVFFLYSWVLKLVMNGRCVQTMLRS